MKRSLIALAAVFLTSLAVQAQTLHWNPASTGAAQAWVSNNWSGTLGGSPAGTYNSSWADNTNAYLSANAATTITTTTAINAQQLQIASSNLTLVTSGASGSFAFIDGISTQGGARTVSLNIAASGTGGGYTVAGVGDTTAGLLTINLNTEVSGKGLAINSSTALGSNTRLVLEATQPAGLGTQITLGNGVAMGSGVTMDIGGPGNVTHRASIVGTIGGTASWAGAISIDRRYAIFDTNGSTMTISGAITTSNPNSTIELAGSSGTGLLSGNLSGVAKMVKVGNGTWNLTGNNNAYSGDVTVNAGTLLVSNTTGTGTGTGAVAVNGGKLGGTGTVGGATTVASGATVQGGDSATPAGTLSFSNNLTLATGGFLGVRITTAGSSGTLNSGTSSGGGANNNEVNVTGTLNVASGSFAIDGTGATFAALTSYSYLIATAGTMTTVDLLSSTDPTRFTFTNMIGVDTTTVRLQSVGTNLYLNFTTVPEPSLMVGLGAGLLGLAALARKRFFRPTLSA